MGSFFSTSFILYFHPKGFHVLCCSIIIVIVENSLRVEFFQKLIPFCNIETIKCQLLNVYFFISARISRSLRTSFWINFQARNYTINITLITFKCNMILYFNTQCTILLLNTIFMLVLCMNNPLLYDYWSIRFIHFNDSMHSELLW